MEDRSAFVALGPALAETCFRFRSAPAGQSGHHRHGVGEEPDRCPPPIEGCTLKTVNCPKEFSKPPDKWAIFWPRICLSCLSRPGVDSLLRHCAPAGAARRWRIDLCSSAGGRPAGSARCRRGTTRGSCRPVRRSACGRWGTRSIESCCVPVPPPQLRRRILPLPLREGRGEGRASGGTALTLTVSPRERDFFQ